MRATPLLLGCLLGLGVIATAVAGGSAATSGTLGNASASYNCNNQSPDHGSNGREDTQAGGGDAINVSHGSTASAPSTVHRNTASSAPESDVTHFNDDSSPNHSSHGSGLSWQSLLPGSIQ
jgi:hypothetical protein